MHSPKPTRDYVLTNSEEIDVLSKYILDYPNIETGGQLFGYWTYDAKPVVLFVLGPGPNAGHHNTFFMQDLSYLRDCANILKQKYGLDHIGEWHSHHQLGLARPSGHDASTMINTIREKGLGHFLLCIGNCDGRSTTLNPFPCDSRNYYAGQWDMIFADSPVRRPADRLLSGIIVEPETRVARHRDSKLNSVTPSKPIYKAGYWLESKENNQQLKDMISYLQGKNGPGIRTVIKLDSGACVHICSGGVSRRGEEWAEDILFPLGFPERCPVVSRWIRKKPVQMNHVEWDYSGNIFKSFVQYYTNL